MPIQLYNGHLLSILELLITVHKSNQTSNSMKNLFKASVLVLLMYASFACKETGQEIVERQEKGTISTKYSADRTTATTYLTGTVTLTAGIYDIVDVAVGANVTFANGANMNQLITHYSTTTATAIKVPSGAFVSIYQLATIELGTTLTNNGNLYGGDVTVNGTFTNVGGSHYPDNLLISQSSSNYNVKFGGYCEAGTIKFSRDGRMTLSQCTQVVCNHVQVEGFIPYTGWFFLYGRGSFKANTAYIVESQFVTDYTINFCCPSISFGTYGSTGNANLTCNTTCP